MEELRKCLFFHRNNLLEHMEKWKHCSVVEIKTIKGNPLKLGFRLVSAKDAA